MLVIRKEQLEALQVASDYRWYGERLADLYPAFAVAGGAQQGRWVHDGVERAKAYGVERGEMLQFLCFEQTFYPGCLQDEAFAWARAILSDGERNAAERVKRLRHATIDRLLEQEAAEEEEAAELEAAEQEAASAEPALASETVLHGEAAA